jgi:hypothetical protein
VNGEPRAHYSEAGAAMRQALARAGDAELSPADRRVLDAVLVATVSWSRLEDEVPLGELADVAGCSARQARRSLARLSALGIVVHRVGRGRSNLTRVGVPPCEKSGQVAVRFSGEEKGTDRASKSGQEPPRKADSHTRARRDREGPRRTEKGSSYIPATTTRNGGPAADEDLARAELILEEFNGEAGTEFTARTYVERIASRLREHPELDADDHREIIERTLRGDLDWVTTLTPNVIYGNDGAFEAAVNRAGLLGREDDLDFENDLPF